MSGEVKQYTLLPEFLQVQCMNPFAYSVTASRADMFASEIGQAPPLANAEVKLIQSGMEREFGRFTDRVEVPCNAIVVAVVHQYPPTGTHTIQTPVTVIYQDMDSMENGTRLARYGVAHIPLHSLNHHVLGFDFKRTDTLKSLRPGVAIRSGTVLAHSPSIDKHGNYNYGVNANVLLGSFPEVRQDGVVIRRGFSEATVFKGYGEMSVSFGEDEIPLNMYGDDTNYKIHPDVGELIRPDGVLFATRKLIAGLYPIQMSRKSLRTHNRTDNRRISKEDNARVISVEVTHSPKGRTSVPSGMANQPNGYLEAHRRYCLELQKVYNTIYRQNNGKMILDPALHNLLTRCEIYTHDFSRDRQRIHFVESGQPLSEYTIKITYSYDLNPFQGHKMAEGNGGKGVFVDVWDDDRMPVDADGNVADIITDGGSIVGRLNLARGYEIDINASFSRTRKTIIASMTANKSRENYQANFDWLLGAYRIISPRFADLVATRDPVEHINAVLASDIVLWMPSDNPVRIDKAILELLEKYPKCHGRVMLTMDDGRKVLSDQPATIGKQYIIILEKTGEEYSAVASPVLQAQGVPGKLTKADKQSSPGRPQATRITGETEGRILNSLVGHDTLFELLDYANSPTTHRAICHELLTHPTPTNIDKIVDRSQTPRGNNLIVNIANDGLFAAGFSYNYRKVED